MHSLVGRYVCPACGELSGAAGECGRDGAAYERCDGDPLVGEDVAGYRIVQLIGRGGMGRVYRAVQRSIGASVAIKVLSHELAHDTEMAERFVAEARIANLVRHDGLVQIIGLGVLPDARPYQVMEHLVGASLASLLDRHGALPPGTLCELVREALRALQSLHERGIVHRDVKPSNMFVTTGGRLKLLDFGIAKLIRPDGRSLTRSGESLGTPEYMAPEQAAGAEVDHRADLYALGVVLFEGATGGRPFTGRAMDAVAPGALDAVIRTAMQPDPTHRFGSAREMEAALGALVAILRPDAFAPLEELMPFAAGRPPPRRQRRWRRWLLVAGALATAAAAWRTLGPHGSVTPARSLDQIRALRDPGEILRALGELDDTTLATTDARRVALDAAARGPASIVEESAPITALAFGDGRVIVASAAGLLIYDLQTGATQRLPPVTGEARALHLGGDRVRALVRDGVEQISIGGAAPAPGVHCKDVSTTSTALAATDDLRYVACSLAGIAVVVVDLGGAVRLQVAASEWVGFSSDGRHALAVHAGRIEVHALDTAALVAAHPVGDVHASALRGELCAIAERSRVVIWNIASGATATVDLAGVEHLAITGSLIAAANEREVVLLDADGHRVNRWTTDEVIRGVDAVSSPGTGLRIVVEVSTGLIVKDAARDRELVLRAAVSAIASSPAAGTIAVASGRRLLLWHTDLVVPWSLALPDTSTYAFAFSHDGGSIAYGDGATAHVLDARTRAERAFRAPGRVVTLAFSPDDRILAAADEDGRVQSWSIDGGGAAGRELGTVGPAAVGELRVANDGSVRIGLRRGPVVDLAGRRPCGPDRVVGLTLAHAVVRDDTATKLCDLATGRLEPLAIPIDARVSLADQRLLAVAGDRPRLFALPGAAEVVLPDATVREAWLDAGRVFAVLPDGSAAVLPERGARPTALTDSAGADATGSRGGYVVADLHHELALWDSARPQARWGVGRIGNLPALRLSWSEPARSVISIGGGIELTPQPRVRLVLDLWPTEARDVREVRRWIETAR